jgi:hypothetical protein
VQRAVKRTTVETKQFDDMHALCDYLRAHHREARDETSGNPLTGRYLMLFHTKNQASFNQPAALEIHRYGYFTKLVVIPANGRTAVYYDKPDGFFDWREFKRTVARLGHAGG